MIMMSLSMKIVLFSSKEIKRRVTINKESCKSKEFHVFTSDFYFFVGFVFSETKEKVISENLTYFFKID